MVTWLRLTKTRANSFDPSGKNLNQDPTLHAGDCDHSGGVKLGRTSIMEIKILNDDGTLGVILLLKCWCVPKLISWVHWLQNCFGFFSMTVPSHVGDFCQRLLVLHHNGHIAPRFNLVLTFMTFIIPQNFYDFYHSSEPGTFQFERRGHLVKESCGEALLSVLRSVSLLFGGRIMNIHLALLYFGKALKNL